MNGFKGTLKRMIAAVLAALLLAGALPALAETLLATASKDTAVYGEASMAGKLGTLEKGAVVEVMGYSTTIAKVSYNGNVGYVSIAALDRLDAEKATLSAGAMVYRSPKDDSMSVMAPTGTQVYALGESGEWTMITRNGTVGYVKTVYVQRVDDGKDAPTAATAAAASAQLAQDGGVEVKSYQAVTTKSTKLYKKASAKSKKLATLKSGVEVTVNATSGGWAYVDAGGKKGFCKLSALKESTGQATPTTAPATVHPATVSVDGLAVYGEAGKGAEKLGTLSKGQAVNVLGWNSDWAYIELDGHYGYCALSGLSKAESDPAALPTYSPDVTNARRGTVTASKLAVYQTASTKGVKLGKLKKGQTVNVIRSGDGWAYIELNGNYGFCQEKGLSIGESDVPAGFKEVDFKATVVSSDARVYASVSANSENAPLKLGQEVQVCAYNDSWACIVQDGKYGFVPIKLLSKAEYAEISGDGADLQTLLKALLAGGYYDAVPTTSYNAAAISAIKRFQSACGMEETGVADQNMLRIVYSGYAPTCQLLFASLSSGDKGDNVSRLQARLYALGYLTKTKSLSGEYASNTAAAVKLFQSASGIDATGTADPATLKALYSTTAKSLPSGTKAADATSSSGGSSGGSTTYLDSVPSGLASTTSTYSEAMSNSEKLEYAIYLSQNKLGCPYVYGATGPEKFDCSGLTTWAYKAIGVSLKRSAYAQGYDDTYAKIEGSDNLRRGDLVFFNTISDSDLSDHAGVYIGDGYFIHASSGGHRVVVSNLRTGYYSRVFSWGRRVF